MSNIRIRTKSGKVYTVDETAVLELCDAAGNLVAVGTIDDRTHVVHIAYPGDPGFARYKRIFEKEASKIIGISTWQDRKREKWQL